MKHHYFLLIALFVVSISTEGNAQVMTYKKYNTVSYKGNTYTVSELEDANLIQDELIPAMEHPKSLIKFNRRWRNTTLIGLSSFGLGILYIDANGPYRSLGELPRAATAVVLVSFPVIGFGLVGYVYTRIKGILKTKKLVKEFNNYGSMSRWQFKREASYFDFTINMNGLGLVYNF